MANDLNLCQFIGRLGKDPETSALPNGNAVAKISIAVGEQWKDKQTGQKQERTTWVPVVAFGRLAEVMGEYLRKGSKVYIQGKLTVRKWQDQSGQDRYTTEIVAAEMQMLDGRNESDGYQQQPPPHQNHQQPQSRPQQQQAQRPTAQNNAYAAASQGSAPRQPPAAYQPNPNAGYAGVPDGAYHQQPAQGFDNFDDDIPF